MDHYLVQSIEKALGWTGPSGLGVEFARAVLADHFGAGPAMSGDDVLKPCGVVRVRPSPGPTAPTSVGHPGHGEREVWRSRWLLGLASVFADHAGQAPVSSWVKFREVMTCGRLRHSGWFAR